MPTSQMIVVHKDIRFDEDKAMQVSLERELEIHAYEELLSPKVERPQFYVEKTHAQVQRVETSTQT